MGVIGAKGDKYKKFIKPVYDEIKPKTPKKRIIHEDSPTFLRRKVDIAKLSFEGESLKKIGTFNVKRLKTGGAVRFYGEYHMPGHNFTGPNTRTDLRLDEQGNPHP